MKDTIEGFPEGCRVNHKLLGEGTIQASRYAARDGKILVLWDTDPPADSEVPNPCAVYPDTDRVTRIDSEVIQ